MMEQAMADVFNQGETREAKRRRTWWRSLTVGIVGMGAVPVILFVFGRVNQVAPGHLVDALPAWAMISLLALFFVSFVISSWLYFRIIDELELENNLWGGSIGYLTFVLLFRSWSWLAAKGIVPERNDWAIYFTCGIVAVLVSGYRRLRS